MDYSELENILKMNTTSEKHILNSLSLFNKNTLTYKEIITILDPILHYKIENNLLILNGSPLLNYIIGANIRKIFCRKAIKKLHLQSSSVIFLQFSSVFRKSFFISDTAVPPLILIPHSKCIYRLLKSRLVVPTVATLSSDTNVFECIKPLEYS